MKKTLIALLALGGFAMADSVTTDLIATTGTTNLGGFGAFDFSVGSGSKFTPAQTIDFSTITGVTLNSIDLSVYNTWYTARHSDVGFGAGIFTKNDNNTWTLIGKTNWWQATTPAYTGTVTLTPTSELTLDLGKTYTVAFFAGKTYFDNSLENGDILTEMPTMAEWKGTTVPASATDLAAVGLKGENAGTGNGIVTYGGATPSTQYIPNVKLNVTTIPEPATATLSLLALAGLASRRRRH